MLRIVSCWEAFGRRSTRAGRDDITPKSHGSTQYQGAHFLKRNKRQGTKPKANLASRPSQANSPFKAKPTMARSQSQSSQREGGEVVRRQSPRKSVTGGSAPVLSGGYLQRHTSKVRNFVALCLHFPFEAETGAIIGRWQINLNKKG